jgi:hypothetical protein
MYHHIVHCKWLLEHVFLVHSELLLLPALCVYQYLSLAVCDTGSLQTV